MGKRPTLSVGNENWGCPFLIGALSFSSPALTWPTSEPVWVQRCPLKREKLIKVKALTQEQLKLGCIEPSKSPWNSPIFVIPRRSGQWKLLHDLSAISAVPQPVALLQQGLPFPATIPKDWVLEVIDLKDCLFTIPLAPQNKEKFPFTVPNINNESPSE